MLGLTRLRSAVARAGDLRKLGIDPSRLGPEWFERWETPRGTYWAATPLALERAGLVVDELADPDDEGKPLYLLPADVPDHFRAATARGQVRGLDLDRFAARPQAPPRDAPQLARWDDGSPVELWGATIPVDRRIGPQRPSDRDVARGRPSPGQKQNEIRRKFAREATTFPLQSLPRI